MSQLSPLPEACYTALVGCLDALTRRGPEAPEAGPALQRLRDLATSLGSELPASAASPDAPLSLSQALELVATARDLLAVLRDRGEGGFPGADSGRDLSETLTRLASGLGAAGRREQADRVRGLYVIIDPTVTGGRDPLEIATAALRGGARMLQLRDKLRDKGETLPLAMALQELCVAHDALLIINDHVDLAAAVGSGGVHVGQTDLPVARARQILAPQQVLGRSNHEVEELVQSQEMGADHVAFGAIYPTTTKGVGRGPQGPERLRQIREHVKVPLVAIGGINAENVGPVVEAGADAICVTAAVGSAPDPEQAASRLVEAIRQAGGRV